VQVDDGSFEWTVGYAGWNGDAFWVNRLTPTQYPATLKQIRIYFPSDGDIRDNTFLSLVYGTLPSGSEESIRPQTRPGSGRVAQVGRWVDFNVTPMTIESGDFLVGFYTPVPDGLKPMALDVSRPAGKSYVSRDGATYVKSETAGMAGNFAIRAVVGR